METKPGIFHVMVKADRRGTLYSLNPEGEGRPIMVANGISYSPNESFRVLSYAAITAADNRKYFTCEDKSSYVRVEDVVIKGKSYTIKSGDMLSTIAEAKYGHAGYEYYMKNF